MAFRCFLSVRGDTTRVMYSDNGTNFVGANSQLQKGLKRIDQRRIVNKLAPTGIEWKYAPPLASHQGGIYEAMIRLVRKNMNLIMTDKRLRTLTDCRRVKGIHSRPDTNRTGAEGLSFYYPRLLHCLDQMLAVMSLSQHRVSSFKTVRPRAPCGARCIGHTVSTWSAVCSEAPHSQFGEGARPHLCMEELNRPTAVRRRLSLTQAARVKPITTGLTLVPVTKARSLKAFSQYSAFHL